MLCTLLAMGQDQHNKCLTFLLRFMQITFLNIGILAYLGFGGYLNLGQSLWGEALNYYLIPILVSFELHAIITVAIQ